MTALSLEFWAFVGVIAGIYTIFALGLQVQFGFTGLLNFGHVAFMAIGAYTMAILVVKSVVPALGGVARRRRRRGRVRAPARAADAAPACRLPRDHDDRVRRDRPLRRASTRSG